MCICRIVFLTGASNNHNVFPFLLLLLRSAPFPARAVCPVLLPSLVRPFPPARAGGGGGSPVDNFLKSRLKMPYAQMTAIKHTKHAKERDSKTASHCHNAVTERLPNPHQEHHMKAEVCVAALYSPTASCAGTSRGHNPPQFQWGRFRHLSERRHCPLMNTPPPHGRALGACTLCLCEALLGWALEGVQIVSVRQGGH